jgi:hypothetical protein
MKLCKGKNLVNKLSLMEIHTNKHFKRFDLYLFRPPLYNKTSTTAECDFAKRSEVGYQVGYLSPYHHRVLTPPPPPFL